MIFGIGTDIVRTERLKAAVEKWGDRFLKRVYTDGEIAYSYKKSNPFLSLAARFAAKEALIKAIGKRTPVAMTDIEIVNNEHGGPSISPKGKLSIYFDQQKIQQTHVSLSHENDYSIAFVVVEK
ncbi:MAG: holo-[acyl-carrier-protein] synthase [Thermodesulfovibrio sp.]|nr:holo-[acyl-carrier-protein] synthase [Thermodesulfovibrio sp.]